MAGDPNYSTVSLLLPFDGANNATTAADYSPDPKTVTFYGNAKITTAQSKWGGASLAIDGSASSRVGVPSSAAFEPGYGDFTVEGFIRPTSTPATAGFIVFRQNASGFSNWSISLRTANKIEAYFSRNSPGATPSIITSATAVSLNTWTHFALVKSGLSVKLFIGGVLDTTVTLSDHPPTGLSTPTYLGSDGTYAFTGSIDDVRVSKYERYSASFTPPTAAFPHGDYAVEGVVRDDSGAPCARTVRLIDRATGALIGSTTSDAGTGAYSIGTDTTDEVQRIVLDDGSGTLYNDLIDRVIPA